VGRPRSTGHGNGQCDQLAHRRRRRRWSRFAAPIKATAANSHHPDHKPPRRTTLCPTGLTAHQVRGPRARWAVRRHSRRRTTRRRQVPATRQDCPTGLRRVSKVGEGTYRSVGADTTFRWSWAWLADSGVVVVGGDLPGRWVVDQDDHQHGDLVATTPLTRRFDLTDARGRCWSRCCRRAQVRTSAAVDETATHRRDPVEGAGGCALGGRASVRTLADGVRACSAAGSGTEPGGGS